MEITQNIQSTVFYNPAVTAQLDFVIARMTEQSWGVIRVKFLDVNNTVVAAQEVEMTLEESNAWGGDDAYVLTLALQKLGIS